MSLEEAIFKMTYKSALTMGIKDRGHLAPGTKADIVIFDKNKIIDKGTYVEPTQYADGIKYVIINGYAVIRDGDYVGGSSGTIVKL